MRTSLYICFLLWALCGLSTAQSSDDWTRLQTANGEFSIEMPDGFSHFFEADGLSLFSGSKDYELRDMHLVNAYRDGTLLSVEIYRASPGAVDALISSSSDKGTDKRKTSYKGTKLKEVTKSHTGYPDGSRDYFLLSRYFHSEQFVYVVTGLSEVRDSPIVKRFLESMAFNPGEVKPADGIRKIEEVPISPVIVEEAPVPPTSDKIAGPPARVKAPEPGVKPVVIASKPRASYTREARHREVTGAVRLGVVFAINGYVPKIYSKISLPGGLTRQAILSALRIKFLPKIIEGVPVSVVVTLEYTFDIY